MLDPADVSLPANKIVFGFIDPKTVHNSHWDLTWSFSFACVGLEHGFTTFLTFDQSTGISGVPGQYLGYLSNPPLDTNLLAIAFDTTGLFALSSTLLSNTNGGVGINQINPNSLIIRDFTNTVVYNQPLSSLDTSFFLTSSVKNYQTLRFRLTNAGRRIVIDKQQSDYTYNNLLTLNISSNPQFLAGLSPIYPAFTFCSPISGASKPTSTLYLKNFHVHGNSAAPTYEIIDFTPLTSDPLTSFTTISGIL